MSISDPSPEHLLKFRGKDDIKNGRAASELKHRYGRGIYVNNVHETRDGDLVIALGNTVPKDISDSMEKDRVLQFINIRDIYTLEAQQAADDNYVAELPDRDEIYAGYQERRQQILNRLDWSMAKAIYDDVFELTPVKNQLNAIIQIVRWVNEEAEITVERLDDAQGSDNTENYIGVLADLGFLEVEDGLVSAGEKMHEAHLADKEGEDYVKAVIGNIVKDGYNVLREKLELRMLRHYPKFCNAYYYDALNRNDPELHLDVEAVTRNYQRQYGEDIDPFVVNDKLNELADTKAIRKTGEYVQSNPVVFNQVAQETPIG